MSPLIRLFKKIDLRIDAQVEIRSGQFHYLKNVMRLDRGGKLLLFNGQDGEFLCEIIDVNKRSMQVHVVDQVRVQVPDPDIWLLFSPIKRSGVNFIAEKATELGVSSIQPIFTSRSTIKLSLERAKKRLIHWRQVSISACEQSGRSKIPTIKSPIGFDQVSEGITTNSLNLLLHPDNLEESSNLPNEYSGDINIFIGPEGGFSPRERALIAGKKNVTAVSLGKNILRADTAMLSALAIWQATAGEWKGSL